VTISELSLGSASALLSEAARNFSDKGLIEDAWNTLWLKRDQPIGPQQRQQRQQPQQAAPGESRVPQPQGKVSPKHIMLFFVSSVFHNLHDQLHELLCVDGKLSEAFQIGGSDTRSV
jgi:hypothetical protein